MGVPHFCSTFLACLYQRYLSSKIEQLLPVLVGIDEHPANKKNKIMIEDANLKSIILATLLKSKGYDVTIYEKKSRKKL